jgi:hypothetical protein
VYLQRHDHTLTHHTRNPRPSRVDPSTLTFSLSSHRHSYISLLFNPEVRTQPGSLNDSQVFPLGQGFSPTLRRYLFPHTPLPDVICSRGIYKINSGVFRLGNKQTLERERERERESHFYKSEPHHKSKVGNIPINNVPSNKKTSDRMRLFIKENDWIYIPCSSSDYSDVVVLSRILCLMSDVPLLDTRTIPHTTRLLIRTLRLRWFHLL